MNKALIIIDYVNDFVAKDGKLTCGEPAQKIDLEIANKVKEFSESGGFIVIASDCHAENDVHNPEKKLFPAHCLVSTNGRRLYGETLKAVENADQNLLIEIDKLRYSAFAGTCLDLKLRERKVTDVYLTGVCSDICVLHTAIDAYNLGYNIYIYEYCIASFNDSGHRYALEHFKSCLGATVL